MTSSPTNDDSRSLTVSKIMVFVSISLSLSAPSLPNTPSQTWRQRYVRSSAIVITSSSFLFVGSATRLHGLLEENPYPIVVEKGAQRLYAPSLHRSPPKGLHDPENVVGDASKTPRLFSKVFLSSQKRLLTGNQPLDKTNTSIRFSKIATALWFRRQFSKKRHFGGL